MTTANDPGWNSFFNATNSPQFNILNNLTLSGGIVYFNSNLKKNLIVNNLTACHNLNYDIIFSGEGEQTYGSTTPGGCSPSLVINKDSGTVSPAAGLTSFWTRRIDVQKGVFNTPSSGTLKIGSIACASETVLRETVGLGQLQMNGANIYFNATRSLSGSCHNTSTINLRPSFEFGNLDLIATQSNGGWHSYLNITNPIVVNGFLNKANYRISGEIFFNGSHFTELTNQTNSTNTGTLNFSSGGAQSYLCSGCNGAQFNKINIINGSVVTLNSNLDLVTTTGDLHILDGILNLASYNLTVARQLRIGSSGVLNANGNSFTPNSGVNYIIDSGGIVNP